MYRYSGGTTSVIAGTPGLTGFFGDGGPAPQALFSLIEGIALDGDGSLYVSDQGNQRIRQIGVHGGTTTLGDGYIRRVAGDGGGYDPSPLFRAMADALLPAKWQYPYALAVGANGTIYAGVGPLGGGSAAIVEIAYRNSVLLPASSPPASGVPSGTISIEVLADLPGGMYVGIQAGVGAQDFSIGSSSDCVTDGSVVLKAGSTCHFPVYFAASAPGKRIAQIIVATNNNQYLFGLEGEQYLPQATLVPGTIDQGNFLDQGTYIPGQGFHQSPFVFNTPSSLVFDQRGNGYLADTAANRVYSVSTTFGGGYVVRSFVGDGTPAFSGDGGNYFNARVDHPNAVLMSAANILYIADAGNHRIRAVDLGSQIISTVAGDGGTTNVNDGGPAISASIGNPTALALDRNGDLLVADAGMHRVRRINVTTGIITTAAGTGVSGTSGDNGPATASQLQTPSGLAVDAAGNIYISDSTANTVRVISPSTDQIKIAAGNGVAGYYGDGGFAPNAAINAPQQLLSDAAGGLYIADTGNNLVRYVANLKSGGDHPPAIYTLAGSTAATGVVNGGSAVNTTLASPWSLALDNGNQLYIAEHAGHDFRIVNQNSGALIFPDTAVLQTSAPQTARIFQSGTTDPNSFPNFSPSIVSSDNDALADFISVQQSTPQLHDCIGPLVTSNGQGCQLSFEFSPESAGAKTGAISIAEQTSTGTLMQYLSLKGNGTGVLPFAFTPLTLPDAKKDLPYSQTIRATGGTGDLSLTESGALPDGITGTSINGSYTLSGTPTTIGAYPFSLAVHDGSGASSTQSFTLTVPSNALTLDIVEAVHVTDTVTTETATSLDIVEDVHVTDAVDLVVAQQLNIDEAIHVVDDVTTTTTKSQQTITFDVSGLTKTYGDPSFAVSASSDSGLPVTIGLVSGPASVLNNVVTIHGAGAVVLSANQPGDPAYNAAVTVISGFTARKALLHVSAPTGYSRPWHTPNDPQLFAGYTNSPLVNGDTRASVGTPELTTNATFHSDAGSYSIFVAKGTLDDTNYILDLQSQAFNIVPASATISFPELPAQIPLTAGTLTLTGTSSSGYPLVYTVSGPGSIAGLQLTLTGTGTVVVTANQISSPNVIQPTAVQRTFKVIQ